MFFVKKIYYYLRRYTDYRVVIRTNLPVFKIKEFACRRR